jgi:hypothetical protein
MVRATGKTAEIPPSPVQWMFGGTGLAHQLVYDDTIWICRSR